jgi:hypothetical protein
MPARTFDLWILIWKALSLPVAGLPEIRIPD